MNMKDLRDKSDEALNQQIATQRRHLFDLRTQAVTEKVENTSQFRKARRDIARVKTVLRQRELAAGGSA